MKLMYTESQDKMTSLRLFWEENHFQLGIPLIDIQHLWLLYIISNLEAALSYSNTLNETMKDSIVGVIDYVSEHFSLEEEILKEFKYPQFKDHVAHHREFVETLQTKHDLANSNELAALGLLNMLQKWLFNHILKEDKQYVEFFKSKSIDVRPFCQEILIQKKYNITKKQGDVYKEVCSFRQSEIEEVISENMIEDIMHIWRSHNLSLHIPVIDLQHIWLLKMVIQLDKAVKTMGTTKKNEVFNQVVEEAIDYTVKHFTLEERIMKEFRYPEILNHFHQHESFVDFIKQRRKENESGDTLAAFHLAQDLKTWLLSHIAHEDKKLAIYLKDKMKDVNEFTRKLHHNGEIIIEPTQRNFYKKITKDTL
ncbi:MAG TPA: bacteriohemerythrin [Leptospiraceae bacterium]|nr:bacteriohemerythrin [Leptospiraceae bacterium]HMX31602.1 bacteriohemerythrin [Leptospiraceae bacterium]HMY29611.1 bacteriohemerythrin [Leptospiraceae bacterium]HMZ62899.1 bacteriohemerythrin [Leptospiraceae bacterium]HNA05950.1 bacteriohemerythrin [Leptospiraceae bacterium]